MGPIRGEDATVVRAPTADPIDYILPSCYSLVTIHSARPFVKRRPMGTTTVFPVRGTGDSILSSVLCPFFYTGLFSTEDISTVVAATARELGAVASRTF